MVRESSDYIIERLTQDKITKEFVKVNKSLLSSFDDYLYSAIKSYSNMGYGEVSYHASTNIFTHSVKRSVRCNMFINWDKSIISKRTVKDFNGLLIGLDLSKVSKKDFEFDSTFGLNRHLDRRIVRLFLSVVTFSDIKDTAILLKNSSGHLERKEIITNFLNKYKFNIPYINKVYNNDLEEFFLDGFFSSELVHRDLNWPDKLDIPDRILFTNKMFFTGPYGKDFCDMVYNDAITGFLKDFDSFRVSDVCFTYLPDKTFAPWVLVSFDSKDDSDGFTYYCMEKASKESSLSKVYSGSGSKKYSGFFDGTRTYKVSVGVPFTCCFPVSKSKDSIISWN